MKNSLKLPLFLGAVCLIASAALAGVNAITSPIIKQRQEDARNRGYFEMLRIESGVGLTFSELQTSEGDLATKGVQSFVYATNDSDGSLFGAVYNGEVKGWELGIKFQVGIVDSKFSGYNNLANSETPSIGGKFILELADMISDVSVNDSAAIKSAIDVYTMDPTFAGATNNFAGVTRSALEKALNACGAHYVSLEVSL